MIAAVSAWVREHRQFTWWLGALSLVTFVATLVVIPLLIVRMPADYFIRDRHLFRDRHPLVRFFFLGFKNLLGLFFLLAGIAMLFLPGQGLLTIFLAVTLLNFPGKRRLEQRLIAMPRVRQAINRLRRRAGRPPLD